MMDVQGHISSAARSPAPTMEVRAMSRSPQKKHHDLKDIPYNKKLKMTSEK
jgi:hypothetical protein